jgi:hypothetical protein
MGKIRQIVQVMDRDIVDLPDQGQGLAKKMLN